MQPTKKDDANQPEHPPTPTNDDSKLELTMPRHKLWPWLAVGLAMLVVIVVAVIVIVVKMPAKTQPNTNSTATSTNTNPFEGELPLGDGKVSSAPQKGYVYSCQSNFRAGAEHAGNWISGNTWDPTKKPAVQGSVTWPAAKITISAQNNELVVTSNDLPNGQTTGIFPIAKTDPAYAYDTNPNSIQAQNISYALPDNPQIADRPSCTAGGAVGIMTNGVLLFNALDASGRDAVAHEVQDSCDGHPQQSGEYHYHSLSSCLSDISSQDVIGYGLDGFGITGPKNPDGSYLGTADLDECHGTTSEINWHGTRQSIYHYVLSADYPYSIGCYKGTPIKVQPAR